jgi:predicted small lipoprotein YifL
MTLTHCIASLAVLALLATGCGQKGPLYLEQPQPSARPAQAAKKPAAKKQTPAQPKPQPKPLNQERAPDQPDSTPAEETQP